MNTDFARNTLLSCPALLDAVLEFNGAFCEPSVSLSLQNGLSCQHKASAPSVPPFPPAPTVSPVRPVAGLDASALWQRVAARRACSRRIPAREMFWDFSHEQRCVALLSVEDLVRLGTLFGAAAYARELRRVVLRAEVQRWQAALGRDVWAYALGRGQYQAGLCAALFEEQDGVLSLHPAREAQLDGLTPARVLACGWAALQSLHYQWPEAVRRRVAEKWATVQRRLASAEVGADASVDFASGFTGAPAEAVWPLLRKILHKELAPAWTPYFS